MTEASHTTPARRKAPAAVSLVALSTLTLAPSPAAADQYEATVVVRPTGAIAHVAEDVGGNGGSPVVASVYGGGLEVGGAYGLRNWLDVGVELGAAAFTRATYDPAIVSISGQPYTGRIDRTTRMAQLRAGAMLRLGVAWIPVIYLGVGLGGSQRTAATLKRDAQGTMGVTPDDLDAGVSFDVVTTARIGFQHRFDERWTLGLDASANHMIGFTAPSFDTFTAGISLGYTWYPSM